MKDVLQQSLSLREAHCGEEHYAVAATLTDLGGIPRSESWDVKSGGNVLFGGGGSNLQSAVMQQPESVALEVDQWAFQACNSRAFWSGCGAIHGQGVLAAGYGTVHERRQVLGRWRHEGFAVGHYTAARVGCR